VNPPRRPLFPMDHALVESSSTERRGLHFGSGSAMSLAKYPGLKAAGSCHQQAVGSKPLLSGQRFTLFSASLAIRRLRRPAVIPRLIPMSSLGFVSVRHS
jgi:hypothetical protein